MHSKLCIGASVALVLALASIQFSKAILIGNGTSIAPQENRVQQLEANATFYYDASAFLLNNSSPMAASKASELEGKAQLPLATSETTQQESKKESKQQVAIGARVKPASVAMTSGRSGRAMDLDALMGDVAASKANKERSANTGSRQSRQFLPGLDVGPGKKLHIQGFIPIMGLKDASSSEDSDGDESSNDQHYNSYGYSTANNKHKPRAQTLASLTGSDLPYGQSSVGHATYGVHRFLNGDAQPQLTQMPQMSQHNNQQFFDASHLSEHVKAASGASAVVDTIRRPIKKLAELASGQTQYSSLISRPQQQQQQQLQQSQFLNGQNQCLCVPFYMCKNGFISESGLGKQQIQQMIMQQQQQQQQQAFKPSPYDQIEMKSSPIANQQQQQLVTSSPTQAPILQTKPDAQYADSYVPVDERSFERELITMSSLMNFNDSNAGNSNATGSSEPQTLSDLASELQQQDQGATQQEQLQQVANSTDLNSQAYSDEILGRMLGLKSSNQRQSTHFLSGSSSSNGVCGLLRTCCQIPMSFQQQQQQDLIAQSLGAAQSQMYQQQQQQQSQLQRVSSPVNSQLQRQSFQQPAPMQQIHRLQQQQQQQLPYGLPSNAMIPQPPPRAQLQPNFNQMDNLLAHRTNQQQQPANRYGQAAASTQLAQYTRSATSQQLQSFQQPQSLTRSLPLGLQQQQQVNAYQPQQALAGTRKILDGRCGLRQALGVTGRVQNLAYHESSAEFGEYPAQAAILKRLPGADSLFVCGGTLISQYWVATAAHCIKKHSQGELKIRLGEWDVHRDDEFYPFVEKEVRDIVVHPEFVSGNLANDLALLRLDSPVDPSLPHVNPACLPTIDENFSRQQCWVTGWGKDSFGQRGSFQSVLREVELPVIGHGECEAALRQTRLGPHYRLNQGFICAGGEGGKDACEGDGGSGLYCAQDGVVKVAGLVSWGIGCGQAGVPGVYVNMAHYRPWIESIISIDEDIYSPYSNMIGSNSPISERSNGFPVNGTASVAGEEQISEQTTTTTTTTSTTPTPSGASN